MPRSGAGTREKIIDKAQGLVYRHGFSGTSIDKVIAEAGITKGAFFYHFKSKADLGRALIERYAHRDLAHLEHTMERAERLSNDPGQQILIFVGLLKEDFQDLRDPIPGCLFTSYLYERDEYPPEVDHLATETFSKWCERVSSKLSEALGSSESAGPRSVTLARTLLALIEGGFVLAKAERDASVLHELLDLYRSQLESLLRNGA